MEAGAFHLVLTFTLSAHCTFRVYNRAEWPATKKFLKWNIHDISSQGALDRSDEAMLIVEDLRIWKGLGTGNEKDDRWVRRQLVRVKDLEKAAKAQAEEM
ncbi:hypothetical protein CALCODRAFT_490663, partial [Calocera cornea HHB12733]